MVWEDSHTLRGFQTLEEQVEGLREYAASPASRVKTGLESIDNLIMGPAPGEVVYIAAAPGAGKSLFVTNIMWRNPAVPMIFFSMEMPYRLAVQRLFGHWGDFPVSQVIRDTESNKLPGVLDAFAEKHAYHIIIEDTHLTLGDMSKFLAMYDEYYGERPRAICIDYLEAIKHDEPGTGNRVEAVAQSLKSWAKYEDVAVFVVHHRNQKRERWDPFEPNDMRYGGERDADVVIGLWEPGEDPNLDFADRAMLKGEIHARITKNRINGRTNSRYHPLRFKLSDSLRWIDLN